jgi:hypothetical protein
MFKPSVHGWHFDNTYINMHEHVDMGGLEVLGFQNLDPRYGLCAGMCRAAMSRYHERVPMDMTTLTPETGSQIFGQLINAQDDVCTPDFWRKVFLFQTRPDQGNLGLGWFTKLEWTKAKAKLDAGIPVTLCLIKAEGHVENPSKNPVVIGYKYLYNEPLMRVVLWVYDTREPRNNNIRIFFSIGGANHDISAAQSNDGPYDQLRGFFIIDHDGEETVGRINSMGINSCTYDHTLAVEKTPGAIVRMDKYNFNFRWNCNFVPGYSVLVNHEYHTPFGGNIYQDIVCPNYFGNLTVPLYFEYSNDWRLRVYAAKIMDREVSDVLWLEQPRTHVYPFLHNRDAEDRKYITDAREDDITTYDFSPTDEEIAQYWNRLVEVAGDKIGSGAHLVNYEEHYELGHVKKPVYVDIDEVYMANPVSDMDIYKTRPQGETSELIRFETNIAIPENEKNRFMIFDAGDASKFGFSEQDYNDDVVTIVSIESRDDIGQHAGENHLSYARSLLFIVSPIYSDFVPGISDWEDIRDHIRQYIDRDLLVRIDDDFEEREMKKIANKISMKSGALINQINYADIIKDKKLLKNITDTHKETFDIAMKRIHQLIQSGMEYKDLKIEMQVVKNKMLERNKTMTISLIGTEILNRLEKEGKLKAFFKDIKKDIK